MPGGLLETRYGRTWIVLIAGLMLTAGLAIYLWRRSPSHAQSERGEQDHLRAARKPMPSRRWPTAACSPSGSKRRLPPASAGPQASPCSISISIISRMSTIRWATARRCSASSGRGPCQGNLRDERCRCAFRRRRIRSAATQRVRCATAKGWRAKICSTSPRPIGSTETRFISRPASAYRLTHRTSPARSDDDSGRPRALSRERATAATASASIARTWIARSRRRHHHRGSAGCDRQGRR